MQRTSTTMPYETEIDSMTFHRLFEFYNINESDNSNERVSADDNDNDNVDDVDDDDDDVLQLSLIESLIGLR
jgi:hypothetical protein